MVILQVTDILVQLLFVLGFSGTFGAGGAYFGYKGLKNGGNWRMFRKADRNDGLDAVEDGDQPVIVDGTVKTDGESLSSPLTGEMCAAYEYKIQTKDNNGPQDNDGWTTVDKGSDETIFYIENESARVRVDPSNADITLEHEVESELEIQQESPEALKSRSSIDLGPLNLTGNQRHRYIENELEVDETGAALGKLVQGRGNADYRLSKTDSNEFIVSDADPQTTRKRLLIDCLKYSFIGLIASSVALIVPALFILS